MLVDAEVEDVFVFFFKREEVALLRTTFQVVRFAAEAALSESEEEEEMERSGGVSSYPRVEVEFLLAFMCV